MLGRAGRMEGRMRYELEQSRAEAPAARTAGIRPIVSTRSRLAGWGERRVFLRMLEHVSASGTVLDLACGTDQFTRLLLTQGYTVGAVDVAPNELDRADGAVAIQKGLMMFLNRGDARQLPFAGSKFDGVTCMRLYRRVPEATRVQMLKEVRRVGRGWAILSFAVSSPWVPLLLTPGGPAHGPLRIDPGIVSPMCLQRELEEAGLTVRAQERVLPFLSEDLVTLVTW